MTKEERARICWLNAQKSRKYNDYVICEEIAFVKMTNTDSVMICDADDWEEWKQYGWHENNTTHYAFACVNGKRIKYHQHILKEVDGFVPDHINHNRLDNRRSNLRLLSKHANTINTKLSKANKSGIKGVRKTKSGNWNAYIFFNGKSINLGTFQDVNDAIRAREKAENKYFKPILDSRLLMQSCDK